MLSMNLIATPAQPEKSRSREPWNESALKAGVTLRLRVCHVREFRRVDSPQIQNGSSFMRRVVTASAVILVSSFAAFAADYGQFETFLGYTYVRFQTSNQFVGEPFNLNVPNFNAHGGSAQFAYNFNRWFSIVADAGAVTSTGGIGDFGNSIRLPALSRGGGCNGILAN